MFSIASFDIIIYGGIAQLALERGAQSRATRVTRDV